MLLINCNFQKISFNILESSIKFTLIFILIVLGMNKLLFGQSEWIDHKTRTLKTYSAGLIENQYSPTTTEQFNNYDVKFYKLDLFVSKNSTEILGTGTIHAEIKNSTLDTFTVELINSLSALTYMTVDSVIINGNPHSFTHADHLIKIPINPPILVGSEIQAQIYYHGNGQSTAISGWNGITNGSAFNSSVTYTYSQPFWSKIWWPCKQILGDKADSIHISITTESDCKAASNGLLESIVILPGNKVRYEWKSNYPIDYYLVSFAVGEYIEHITYAEFGGTNDSIMIQSFLFQDCPFLAMHLAAIEKTKDYLQLFSSLFGDYPFKNEKYGYCLTKNRWGAMEHQTMTTTGYEALDTTAALIAGYYYLWYSAHELGHSWFGDNVTCATWQDIWINEGFASYSEYLALQYLESQNSADFWMNNAHEKVLSELGGSVYIPNEFYNNEDRIFDYRLTYKKGATIVHMIRFELENDSLFFLILKTFQNNHKYGVATGLDFKYVLESITGQIFTDFFNQWYFGEGYPIYNITWEQINDTLRLHSHQTSSTNVTPLFKMPLEIKLNYAGGDSIIKIYQNSNDEYFEIIFSPLITDIEVDPNNWVLDQSFTHTLINKEGFSLNSFYLYQNYPNPFNINTTIQYYLPTKSMVTLEIYNLKGQIIKTLINDSQPAGTKSIEWDGTDKNNKLVSSGIYIYVLKTGDNNIANQNKKMLLLK